MIKNLLENDGISSSIKYEIIGSRGGTWKPGGSVKIVVSDMDYERAKLIVLESLLSGKICIFAHEFDFELQSQN